MKGSFPAVRGSCVETDEKILIPRMCGFCNWCIRGAIFAAVGLIFVYTGARLTLAGRYFGIIFAVIGGIVAYIGISNLIWFVQRLEITREAVRLKLGPWTLWQLPAANIRALAAVTMVPNSGWEERGVILLSTRTRAHMRTIGASRIHDWPGFNNPFLSRGLDVNSPKVQINAYVDSRLVLANLPRKEGIWMEFSRERARAVLDMFPNAEDCIS